LDRLIKAHKATEKEWDKAVTANRKAIKDYFKD
jgi:hypothetical protein